MIKYIIGDATEPVGDGNKLIVHCCNDSGGWGAGFTAAISKRWSEPEMVYKAYHRVHGLHLGDVHHIAVRPGVWVTNVIGQRGYGTKNNPGYPFVRYDALESGLKLVLEKCHMEGATVHMPRIGCGLAGGTWDRVESILDKVFVDVTVFVYDLRD